jgi:hypothetical protein
VHAVVAQMIVGAADLAAGALEDILATRHPQYPERE